MTANQLINRLTFAEVSADYEPDTRRMLLAERFAVQSAARSGDSQLIADAMAEAKRVAKMWGVKLN